MIDEICRFIKKIVILMVLFPLRMLPTKKNRLLFNENLAHKYSDNIKAIINYMITHYEGKFEIYLAVIEPLDTLPSRDIKLVKFNSLQYFLVAMTSRFLVSNSGGYSYLPLKADQFVINTWHGGGAGKKFGVDAYNVSKLYKFDVLLAANKTNYFFSTSKMSTEVFSKALLIPKEKFIEVGMPRNDILIKKDSELRKRIRRKLGIKNKKMVLYAPTYRRRDDNTFGESISVDYGIDASRVCEAFNRRFGGDWVFAIRLHPAIKDKVNNLGNNVIDLSNYDDMQELLVACDAMINDFSSSMWDFIHTKKPGFMFATDIDHYTATTALYVPVEKWPFKRCDSNEALIANIERFDEKEYNNRCEEYYRYMGECETGEASKKACELIYEKCYN